MQLSSPMTLSDGLRLCESETPLWKNEEPW
jgi:hypothetical protein